MDCWSCGAERGDAAFCPTCERIQPSTRRESYFELLGVSPKMQIDLEALDRSFRDRSQRMHPDRFGRASPVERRLAVQRTAELNEAYRTLKDVQKRAEYLMKLEGVEIGTEESRTSDRMLLMEMMELQEQIDEIADAEAADRMTGELDDKSKEKMAEVVAYFDDGKGERDTTVAALDTLRYLARLKERVEARREEIG